MKIAIVGAGFSGIATAWFCLEKSYQVTLFDAKGLGRGASGIAAGLLHPFASPKAHLNWNGILALQESLHLLDIASKALGFCVYKKTGMFRPAVTEKQRKDFKKAVEQHPVRLEWQNPKFLDCSLEGLFIHDAYTVDSRSYLKGLWKACTEQGALLEIAKITHIDALFGFDGVVFATGGALLENIFLPQFERIKGQLLELELKEHLPFAVNSNAYVAKFAFDHCTAGATFERSWKDEHPDVSVCEPYIRKRVALFSPQLASLPLSECRSAFRAMSPTALPIVQNIGPRSWYIGAMGAKGLLYHALFAKQLVALLYTI
jgi:glycine/D-amino acid oxidase-like deaminating enzyme